MLVTVSAVMGVTALVLGVVTWSRVDRSIDAVRLGQALRAEWVGLLSLMKDVETGQRGFQITGDESYLEPYSSAVEALPQAQSRTLLLLAEDRAGQERFARVQEHLGRTLELLQQAVLVRQREGEAAGAQWIANSGAKAAMDAVREEINGAVRGQDATTRARIAAMESDLRWGYASSIAAGAVALGSGAFAFWLFLETMRQVRREERLSLAKQRAEQADREKSTFLATMSHEIRTPMNAILGFGELLEAEVGTEKERRYVQSILNGGRSLLQIINDILDISKIEAGMLEVRPEPTDPRELAHFIRQMFAQQAARQALELRVEVEAAVPRCLMLDGVRMRQILLNLVGNALKFTERGHVLLHVGGRRAPDARNRWQLVIRVEDTGIGIPRNEQADVFRPFVQTRSRAVAEQHGTGLGLAIVKRLTHLMNGGISLRSESARGTTFTLEFPEVEISARLPDALPADSVRVEFDDLRPSVILVADDNETNLTLLRGIFEGTHHRLITAVDGREALTKVEQERPDVVLMDVRMPVMDGRQALGVLRARPGLEMLPVIAVTASSLAADEQEIRRSFDGYVRKPFTRVELFRQLAQFIPRGSADTPSAAVPVVPAPEDLQAWRDLVPQLRALEHSAWPRVRDGMAMSDVRAFAETLEHLAKSASCEPLASYAERLLAESATFSLDALEATVAGYPALVSQIEQAASPFTNP